MNIVKVYNGLNGAIRTREEIKALIDQAKSQEQPYIVDKLESVLTSYPDEETFSLTVENPINEAVKQEYIDGLSLANPDKIENDPAWFPEYKQFKNKPKEAIKHLLKKKKGNAVKSLYREGAKERKEDFTGYIDIPWGKNNDKNKGFGLKHIVEKHGKEIEQLGFKVEDFIPIVISFGIFKDVNKKRNRIELKGNSFTVVIDKNKNSDRHFILTSFDLRPVKFKKGLNGAECLGIDLGKLREHNKMINGVGFTMPPLYSTTSIENKDKTKNNENNKNKGLNASWHVKKAADYVLDKDKNGVPAYFKDLKPKEKAALNAPKTQYEKSELFHLPQATIAIGGNNSQGKNSKKSKTNKNNTGLNASWHAKNSKYHYTTDTKQRLKKGFRYLKGGAIENVKTGQVYVDPEMKRKICFRDCPRTKKKLEKSPKKVERLIEKTEKKENKEATKFYYVYVKFPNQKRFSAMNLSKGIQVEKLIYATRIPESKIEELKEILKQMAFSEVGTKLEIRSYQGAAIWSYKVENKSQSTNVGTKQLALFAPLGEGDFKVSKRILKANERFNQDLDKFIKGDLPDTHVFKLGKPSKVLESTGTPNLMIELRGSRIFKKTNQVNHIFEALALKNLVKSIHFPIAIFRYGNGNKSQNIITNLQIDDKNILVGIHFEKTPNHIEVNSIRGLFPKDIHKWLNWIQQNKQLYLDKKRVQDLITQQRTHLADVSYLNLNSITNIINNFENPTICKPTHYKNRETVLKNYEVGAKNKGETSKAAVANPKDGEISPLKNKDTKNIQNQKKGLSATAQNKDTIRFNKAILTAKREGIDPGKTFNLGKTKQALKKHTVDGNITLSGSVIKKVMSGIDKAHSLTWENLINLPDYINNPFAIFDSSTIKNSFVVLVEIKNNLEKPVMVAIKLHRKNDKDRKVNVMDIRSIYSKRTKKVYRDWYNEGKLIYYNKESDFFKPTMGPIPTRQKKSLSKNKDTKNKSNPKKGLSAPNVRSINAQTERAPMFAIGGETAKFLQAVEKKPVGSVVVTLDGPQGAGKTTSLFQFLNDFAEAGNNCLFASLEEHPASNLFAEKRDKYLSREAQSLIDVADHFETTQELYDTIDYYDCIFIDSWQKLERMIGRLRLDEDLRKRFDGKVFFIIFQQTTTGRTKGGAEIVFDGDIIVKLQKEKSFADNYAYFDKNRYTKIPLENLRYNVLGGYTYNPNQEEEPHPDPANDRPAGNSILDAPAVY